VRTLHVLEKSTNKCPEAKKNIVDENNGLKASQPTVVFGAKIKRCFT
jgi:hypothetical protein